MTGSGRPRGFSFLGNGVSCGGMQTLLREFQSADLPRVREIFYASSARQKFASDEEREGFAERWLGPYLRNYQKYFWVAEVGGHCAGYLTGCPASAELLAHFADKVASFALFRDQFAAFPAHLHLNVDAAARGKGVGADLIARFAEQVPNAGVHIITSPSSRNRDFYRRNGFSFELEREIGKDGFLFMGLPARSRTRHS